MRSSGGRKCKYIWANMVLAFVKQIDNSDV